MSLPSLDGIPGAVMTHVNLDGVDESVKKILLAVALDPAGSVLELNGQPVAWVVPISTPPGNGDEVWTEAKNQRRCDLIDRKYAGSLSPTEAVELAQLQEQMLRHRQGVAPPAPGGRPAPAPGTVDPSVLPTALLLSPARIKRFVGWVESSRPSSSLRWV